MLARQAFLPLKPHRQLSMCVLDAFKRCGKHEICESVANIIQHNITFKSGENIMYSCMKNGTMRPVETILRREVHKRE
jgi:hypothetical protein